MKSIPIILIYLLSFYKIAAQEQPYNLSTASGEIKGSLTMPAQSSSCPIVLIIAGSGPTDRDGNNAMMKNNSLKMLANELLLNGIASVRFDKRGIAASASAMVKEDDLRFETYINDVNDWLKRLASDNRFSKIIIAGHSEGSLIGMAASINSLQVAKFISIAGAGSPADEILKEQMSKQPQMVKDMVNPKIDSLKKGLLLRHVNPMLLSLFRPSVQPYMISWFKYDPVIEMGKLKIPVLILQGDKDIQVAVNEANKLALAAKDGIAKVIPNMNHVLKNCDTTEMNAQLKIYNDPNLPLNAELIQEIVKFIRN